MSDWSLADIEWELKMEQMRADIRLDDRQTASAWAKVVAGVLLSASDAFTAFGWSLGVHR